MNAVEAHSAPLSPWSLLTSRWRSALGQGAIVLVGYALVAMIGMGALRLYTELAPKAVFGESNLLLTMLALGMQLFVAPFSNTQLRYHTEAQARGSVDAFSREVFIWSLRAATALGAVAFIGCLLSGALGGLPLSLTVALCAAVWALATATRNVLINRLQAERKRLTYVGLLVTEAILTTVFTGAALAFAANTGSYVAGQAAAAIALALVIAWLSPLSLRPSTQSKAASAEYRQRALKYGLPFAPLAILNWVSNLADRYVLGIVLGAAAVGQYVAPLSIASRAMTMTSGALTDLIRPSLFDAENRGQLARARNVFLFWITVSASVGAGAVLFILFAGDWVARLLLSESYRTGAVPVMAWVAAGFAVFGLNQAFENRLMSLGRTAQLMVPTAIGAIANVVLSLLLVRRHGILGAAQASCLSFVAQCLVTAGFMIVALRRRTAATASGSSVS